jgi:hypothetical protein
MLFLRSDVTWHRIDAHRWVKGVKGVRGLRGGFSKIFTKLVNKNAKKNKNGYPPLKKFTTAINPTPRNLAKTSWTLPLDFPTVCIYV